MIACGAPFLVGGGLALAYDATMWRSSMTSRPRRRAPPTARPAGRLADRTTRPVSARRDPPLAIPTHVRALEVARRCAGLPMGRGARPRRGATEVGAHHPEPPSSTGSTMTGLVAVSVARRPASRRPVRGCSAPHRRRWRLRARLRPDVRERRLGSASACRADAAETAGRAAEGAQADDGGEPHRDGREARLRRRRCGVERRRRTMIVPRIAHTASRPGRGGRAARGQHRLAVGGASTGAQHRRGAATRSTSNRGPRGRIPPVAAPSTASSGRSARSGGRSRGSGRRRRPYSLGDPCGVAC